MPTIDHKESDVGFPPPKKGDKFRCKQCGMQLEITVDCKCKEEARVHFHCCESEMSKVS